MPILFMSPLLTVREGYLATCANIHLIRYDDQFMHQTLAVHVSPRHIRRFIYGNANGTRYGFDRTVLS